MKLNNIYSKLSLEPLKGGSPDNKIYNITPDDQISHFSVYFPANISGGT